MSSSRISRLLQVLNGTVLDVVRYRLVLCGKTAEGAIVDLQLDTAEPGAELGRSARRRQAILAAATEVFVRQGYLGATTDQVAAAASVSKQTVYKQFGDKQHLFAEV